MLKCFGLPVLENQGRVGKVYVVVSNDKVYWSCIDFDLSNLSVKVICYLMTYCCCFSIIIYIAVPSRGAFVMLSLYTFLLCLSFTPVLLREYYARIVL